MPSLSSSQGNDVLAWTGWTTKNITFWGIYPTHGADNSKAKIAPCRDGRMVREMLISRNSGRLLVSVTGLTDDSDVLWLAWVTLGVDYKRFSSYERFLEDRVVGTECTCAGTPRGDCPYCRSELLSP